MVHTMTSKCVLEVHLKFASIVRLDVFDFALHERLETVEEISSGFGAVRRVSANVGNARISVECSENVPLRARTVDDHRINAHEVSRPRLLRKLSDALLL